MFIETISIEYEKLRIWNRLCAKRGIFFSWFRRNGCQFIGALNSVKTRVGARIAFDHSKISLSASNSFEITRNYIYQVIEFVNHIRFSTFFDTFPRIHDGCRWTERPNLREYVCYDYCVYDRHRLPCGLIRWHFYAWSSTFQEITLFHNRSHHMPKSLARSKTIHGAKTWDGILSVLWIFYKKYPQVFRTGLRRVRNYSASAFLVDNHAWRLVYWGKWGVWRSRMDI